jgi:hypothetical protein
MLGPVRGAIPLSVVQGRCSGAAPVTAGAGLGGGTPGRQQAAALAAGLTRGFEGCHHYIICEMARTNGSLLLHHASHSST